MTMRSHEQQDAFTLPRDAERLGITLHQVPGSGVPGAKCEVRVVPAGREGLYRLEMDIGPVSFRARRPMLGRGIAWHIAPGVLLALHDVVTCRQASIPWLLTMLSEDDRPL